MYNNFDFLRPCHVYSIEVVSLNNDHPSTWLQFLDAARAKIWICTYTSNFIHEAGSETKEFYSFYSFTSKRLAELPFGLFWKFAIAKMIWPFLDFDENSIFLAYFGKISTKHTFYDVPKFIWYFGKFCLKIFTFEIWAFFNFSGPGNLDINLASYVLKTTMIYCVTSFTYNPSSKGNSIFTD